MAALAVEEGLHENGHGPSKTTAENAGALFVLESKGNWVHAGYHLTTSIAGPGLLSLPLAFAGLGWAAGGAVLLFEAALTFYAYWLVSKVLEHLASIGRRHIRFRDLAHDILGRRWGFYVVATVQFLVCFGAIIVCIVLGGQSMQLIYSIYNNDGSMKLYNFIIIFGAVMLFLAQMPSFHSLRHINLLSLLTCLGYSACAVGGSVYAGLHHSTKKNYSVQGGSVSKMFGVFNSCAIIATAYGCGIIPEIQATLVPPVTGKMFKGLCICYTVVVSTFFSVAVSGYWAFGNQSSGNLMSNFAPSGQPPLVPNWLNFLANMLILMQLFAVALVYAQPLFEVFEGKASDVSAERCSLRNLLPRVVLRSFFVALGTFISAMIPFFGDIMGLIGAVGIFPLDFIFPMVFYNLVFKPSRRSLIFWFNTLIAVIYAILCILATISSVRQIALDADTYKLFANF